MLYESTTLLQGYKAAYPLSTPCGRKLGETQPAGSKGWLVPPKTGVLRAPSPSAVTALDNVFQVFGLRTKKLFSVPENGASLLVA